ncbi:MAG: inorganic phosphate transporter [Deltaproteobacteria bacterium]|nr:inorganic phosphate transporter [Deltaproteobacteria bacterium]
MDFVTLLLAAAAVSALYMAWNIGANDVANAMGTSVGSGALTLRQALVAAAIFELAGAVFFGSTVTETIADGIVEVSSLPLDARTVAGGLTCCLISAAVWLHFATQRGWPVSTTHAIVGSVLGFGLVVGGPDAVEWSLVSTIAIGWVVSPVLGGLVAWLLFRTIQRRVLQAPRPARGLLGLGPAAVFVMLAVPSFALLVDPRPPLSLGQDWTVALPIALGAGVVGAIVTRIWLGRELRDGRHRTADRLFIRLQIVTACFIALAHGSNDVANAVGPMAGVFAALGGHLTESVAVPMNLLLIGAVGIVLGLATFGFRVMATIGREITELTAAHGFAAELGAALTIVVASELGLPVSTTQVLVGAVVGVGLSRSIGAINLRVVREIAFSWVSTVPVTAGLAALLTFLVTRLF